MSFLTADQTPRVVLDSNVWIDILVFDDPHARPIAAALAQGGLEAVIDARCLAELTRVLDYPQFARFALDKEAALAQIARWTTMIAPAQDTPAGEVAPRALPQCRDRDDQKFLELARRAGAAWLVSKDRELLRMAKRIARDFGFSIGLPAAFTAQLSARLAAQPAAKLPASLAAATPAP
jgi:uncharacterized protein